MSDQYTGYRVNDGPYRYLAVLDGPNLAPSDFTEASHIVPLASLAEAEHYLTASVNGYVSRWLTDKFVNLAGQDTGEFPGGLSVDAALTLYRLGTTAHNLDTARMLHDLIVDAVDPYPDYVLSVGPRGGIKRERA